MELDADLVKVTSVATERGPGVGPLETITLSFESLGDPVWTAAGGPMKVPEEFPGQERVGPLTPGTTDVMATSQLVNFSIVGTEQWASGIASEPAFNRVTLAYERIRETVAKQSGSRSA